MVSLEWSVREILLYLKTGWLRGSSFRPSSTTSNSARIRVFFVASWCRYISLLHLFLARYNGSLHSWRFYSAIPHGDQRPPALWPNTPITLCWQWANQFFLSFIITVLMPSTRLGSAKYQLYMSLVWLGRVWNLLPPTRDVRQHSYRLDYTVPCCPVPIYNHESVIGVDNTG